MNAISGRWTRATGAALALSRPLWLPLWRMLNPPLPLPLQLHLLLLEADRARTVHQLAAVQALGLSWLAAQHLLLLERRLHLRLEHLQNRPPSPTSTSSKKRTARRTGKRRR